MQKLKRKSPSRKRQIGQKKARESFIALHPAFELCWEEAKETFEDTAIRNVYTVIAERFPRILAAYSDTDFSPVMEYAETLLREGTDRVYEIVALYFIGSLLGTSDVFPEVMAPLLRKFGPLSRAYAVRWNKSLGQTNLGLER